MKKKLERIVPPGYGTEKIFTFWCFGMFLCVLISLTFFLSLSRELLRYPSRQFDKFTEILLEGAYSGTILHPLRHSCYFFLAAALLIFIPIHYTYYFSESKSIYTMCRIGRPFERHIRAWTLPLFLVVATLLLRVIVILVMFCGYLASTTQRNIPANQWEDVWRLIIYDRNY